MSLLLMTLLLFWTAEHACQEDRCQSNKLVIYRVIFQTFWSRHEFPRQYPEWRPPAQWSKLIGFSHDAAYHLFRLGQESSQALKEFAESGKTDSLDKQQTSSAAQHHGTRAHFDRSHAILDSFQAPPIDQGVGKTEGSLFVDGNHTMVSLISKMVPSPDWFVGLDSLNLCENGHFIDSVSVKADPLDAGTDNGFTFTSPNWPTVPQGTIFRITNNYPPHPAGSFHYPEKTQLPTIAKFTFIKEREYELSEIFEIGHDSVDKGEVLSMSQVNKYSYQLDSQPKRPVDGDDEAIVTFVSAESSQTKESNKDDFVISNEILTTNEQTKKDRRDFGDELIHKNLTDEDGHQEMGYYASTGPENFFKKRYDSPDVSENLSANAGNETNDEEYDKLMAVFEDRKQLGLSESMEKSLEESKLQRRRHHRRRKRLRGPRPCKVSEWSEWSPCSKSCGIGESSRTRKVLRPPKDQGKPCPKLTAIKWCGSARNCRNSYFKW